jgi:protein TonB
MAENARLLKSFYPAPGTVSFGGRVSVSARIGVDGKVKSTKIKITSGRPLVDAVAMSAARHWVYKPATDRYGKPMECDAIIIIPFERFKE